jgi:CheY-like chemotaxis protein
LPSRRELEAGARAAECLLVDGELPTRRARRHVLEIAAEERLLVDWQCSRAEAEREVFHRYVSRPECLTNAEFERYLADARIRNPVEDDELPGGVVHLDARQPIDVAIAQVAEQLRRAPRPLIDGQRRVMVVEDDADQRALLAEVLAELGYVVELAPDAGVAIALLETGVAVELLISDQVMPGMTGVELAREVRRRHPAVRSVLLTAYGSEQICRDAVDAQAITVLSKPLRMVDLERVLEEATAL